MNKKAQRAAVYTLSGEKVHVFPNCNEMDFSKLSKDIYIIKYLDKEGNVIGQEKIVIS